MDPQLSAMMDRANARTERLRREIASAATLARMIERLAR